MLPIKTAKFCLLLLLSVFTTHSWACARLNNRDDGDVAVDDNREDDASHKTVANACCVCGAPIDMTILVSNQIKEPYWEIQTKIFGQPQRELIHQLEQAASQDGSFKFTAKHFGSMGYMITAINGLEASDVDKTYWRLSSSKESPDLTIGASTYMPGPGEIMMFNLTSYATPTNH